jgi:hypothetical protein
MTAESRVQPTGVQSGGGGQECSQECMQLRYVGVCRLLDALLPAPFVCHSVMCHKTFHLMVFLAAGRGTRIEREGG